MQDLNSSGRRPRLLYIDGLKGIACVMIMLGHFTGVVKYASDTFDFPCITGLYKSAFSNIIDEGFWLQLFFVISGFLLSHSEISNLKDLIKKIGKRFLRFYLPIQAACLVIYFLSQTVGFHSGETTEIFTCQWFQKYYNGNYIVLDLLRDPVKTVFTGITRLNAPYWVIGDMFYSSLLIYFISYISAKISKISKAGKINRSVSGKIGILVYAVIIIAARKTLGTIYSACLTGAWCGVVLKECRCIGKIPRKTNTVLCVLGAVLALGLHTALYLIAYRACGTTGILSKIVRHLEFIDGIWGVFYFAALIILIAGNERIQRILSSGLFLNLNKISFGVFSFHWPLLCSVGALLMIAVPTKWGIITGWIVSVILTLIVSIGYHCVFEKNIDRIMKKIA